MTSVQQIIATINPDLYYDTSASNPEIYSDFDPTKEKLRKFKEYIKTEGFQRAVEKAKPKSNAVHSLEYDSSAETLEPVYFFILDLIGDFGFSTEKLIDNFSSSPGSGHFAELGQRATIMQQQGTKILGDINTVLRSVLNIIYDLKDFRLRLSQYDELRASKSEAAILSLKQIWMDKVDIQKGNSSIKAMALGQMGFQTLIDAFLFVKNVSDVDKIDLNDRVKRILRARILEFNHWLEQSEKELRKRYEIEKAYLRSQVNSLKLYARWAKPYLKIASDLEMTERGRDPALVKAFNTIVLELVLIGKREINTRDEALAGNLPRDFERLKTRAYYACVLVEFRFRGIPQKISQQPHYTFGGRAEISFKPYALSEDELYKLTEELESSDLGDVLRLIQGATDDSLEQIQDEINFFLEEEEIPSEKSKNYEQLKDTSNPFLALIGKYDSKPAVKEKNTNKKQKTILKPETYAEKEYVRPLAAEMAKDLAFKFFDIYKKAHGMPSFT